MKTIYFVSIFLFLFSLPRLSGQSFTQVEGQAPSTANLEDYWTGAAWIDVDNDSDLDLFLTNRIPGINQRRNFLFINNAGVFESVTSGDLVITSGFWFGNTWGDYDNDGLTDVFVAGFPGGLFKNLGDGDFEKINTGEISLPTLSGIGVAFGDLNNDGYLDLVSVRPNWIQGPPNTGTPGHPHVMINEGPPNFSFTRLIGTDISGAGPDTYLQPTLSDFDDDGDLDLFIGMGSGMPKKDLLFKNLFTETGFLNFERMENIPLAETLLEGNQWSFEDIDNDGDLDAYVTNWANSIDNEIIPRPNTLFLNDGNNFTETDAGPITTDADLSTTACWGDFDNDADLDVITVSDSTYALKFYQNDGNGNFTSIEAGSLSSIDKHQSGASAGDFDNDGDLDLFVPGPGDNTSFLSNELDNGFNWLKIIPVGTTSNSSAIGAKLWLHAQINGSTIVQRREVSGASTFFGTNSLIQHFGLNTATEMDSLIVEWPSGLRETFLNIPTNQLSEVIEGQGIINSEKNSAKPELQVNLFPNPASDSFYIEVKDLSISRPIYIDLLDHRGIPITRLFEQEGLSEINLKVDSKHLANLTSGSYYIRISAETEHLLTKEFLLVK